MTDKPSAHPNDVPVLSPLQERQKNLERLELILSFYRGLKMFRELSRRARRRAQGFRFNDMDHLIENHLRKVKDLCHKLFRESEHGETERILQAFFDLYFGVLFHTLLKAKENLRLRENYNIQRLNRLISGLKNSNRRDHLPVTIRKLFRRLAREFANDTRELAGEMTEARFMFNQLEKIFNRIIQVYADNAKIIRSLYCQKNLFAEVFPRQGIHRLFGKIFRKNGPTEAFVFLGFDYLRSGHLEESRGLFLQAIQESRKRKMPVARLRQLYEQYRDRTIGQLSTTGTALLAFRLRLREIETTPALRLLVGNHANDQTITVE
ncbi:MAG: hypothetical protein N3D11_06025 [Candidatus Sumerlaeia bacterium]|nr:hypothetical protein [Candidatus Sumerlaeia bacterium]